MKLITRDTDYAIRALGYLAASTKKIVPVSELVGKLKIPKPFLRKNLQILEKKGLLKSYKGQGGGFALARPPHKIFILDLINIFQGRFKLNECFFKKNICPQIKSCLLKRKIDKIEQRVLKELGPISLAYILR